jgi:ankyrin repeat protein
MYKSECCLHFCALAGEDGVDLATDILAHPVLNPCLKPDLSEPANAMLGDYTPVDDSLWTCPRLDRPDEDGNTPLYYAVVNGEFPLARLFLKHSASCREKD